MRKLKLTLFAVVVGAVLGHVAVENALAVGGDKGNGFVMATLKGGMASGS